MTQQEIKAIADELHLLQVMADDLSKRAYRLRLKLGRFHAPAPNGGYDPNTDPQFMKVMANLAIDSKRSQIKKGAIS